MNESDEKAHFMVLILKCRQNLLLLVNVFFILKAILITILLNEMKVHLSLSVSCIPYPFLFHISKIIS